MNGPGDYHTKWSKSDREGQMSYPITYCGIKTKVKQTHLSTKQKLTHRFTEQIYSYQGGRVGGIDRLGIWDWHAHTAIFKIDDQQGPSV